MFGLDLDKQNVNGPASEIEVHVCPTVCSSVCVFVTMLIFKGMLIQILSSLNTAMCTIKYRLGFEYSKVMAL